MTFSVRRSVIAGCLLGWLAACSSSKPDETAGVVKKSLTSPDGVVSAVLSYTSDWGTGYCANVRVSNTGTTATTSWGVAINLNQSTVTSSWSATFANSNGQLNVTPLSWNASIAAGGFTEFGFCANAPSSTNRPTITSVTQTGASGGSTSSGGAPSAGGSPSGGATPASGGTNPASGGTSNASGGTGPATPGVATLTYQSDWGSGYCANVTVTNSGSAPATGWNVVINLNQATLSSSWSASFASSNGVLTVTPLSWNATIAANGSIGFGFCANGSARPVIVSASLSGGGGGTGGAGTGGAPAATGGAPAATGGTATGGTTSPASGGTTSPATGGASPATGGTSTASGGSGPSTIGAATLSYQSDWGSGYCANVTVTNSASTASSSWTVVINLNQATVTSSWSATFANSSGMLTVTPNSWNGTIPANGSVTFGFCANASGTLRPVIASATVNTGGGGTGGAGAGGSPATGGTAPATGGKAPATGGVPAATGGAAPATGGTATGGTGPAICRTVATLPVQATACTGDAGSYDGDSVCDASGNRCICARGIWYCGGTCASKYPTPPVPNSACAQGTACNYPAQGTGCACVAGKWMCIGGNSCPTAAPMTGDACDQLTGMACDYPGTNHFACACTANADAGAGSSWTCVVSARCPATQPTFPSSCPGAAICAYGSTQCACLQNGSTWMCL
jgi:hypothetical protein